MSVVCNSSVLITLSVIDQLRLLQKRFGGKKVVIPQAVFWEVVEQGRGQPGAKKMEGADWISVRSISNRSMVRLLEAELDRGEAEAIVLAHELGAKMILLDEREARKVAAIMGLKPLGTIGILLWAKREGLIHSLQEQLNVLQEEGRFRISPELYRRALREVMEKEKDE